MGKIIILRCSLSKINRYVYVEVSNPFFLFVFETNNSKFFFNDRVFDFMERVRLMLWLLAIFFNYVRSFCRDTPVSDKQ